MIDLTRIMKKANISNVKTIDAMIEAGHEYVVVDGYATKWSKKYKSNEDELQHYFHDKKSGNWFKGAGISITKDLLPQFEGHEETEINEAFETRPQLWQLSPIIEPAKGNKYRPTHFMGPAADYELLAEEMEEQNGAGLSGLENRVGRNENAELAKG